jgi:uncharacterized protein YbcI
MEEHAMAQSDGTTPAAAAADAIVKLHRDHYGRGASSARSVYQGNYLVVFLEDIYTPVERTLINAGDHAVVRETRTAFQLAMRNPFAEAIEEVTGRKVIQFMSQVSFEPDLAAEIFVLAPEAA